MLMTKSMHKKIVRHLEQQILQESERAHEAEKIFDVFLDSLAVMFKKRDSHEIGNRRIILYLEDILSRWSDEKKKQYIEDKIREEERDGKEA